MKNWMFKNVTRLPTDIRRDSRCVTGELSRAMNSQFVWTLQIADQERQATTRPLRVTSLADDKDSTQSHVAYRSRCIASIGRGVPVFKCTATCFLECEIAS